MKFHIEQRYLKALLLAASKKDIRYYFNGISFRCSGTTLTAVATDGHRMLIAQREIDNSIDVSTGTNNGQCIIPRDMIERALKWRQDSLGVFFTIDEKSVALNNAQGDRLSGEVIDAKFPDFERIIPRQTSGEPAAFNTKYIADFSKTAELLCPGEHKSLRIDMNGKGAALIRFFGVWNAWGILMPVHADDSDFPEIPESFNSEPSVPSPDPEPIEDTVTA